jgi:5-methylcytosine-specific restriction protein A
MNNAWWIKRKFKEVDPFSERAKYQRFYQSAKWQRTRLIKLAESPLCEMCLVSGMTTPAVHVDHIVPLSEDYNKRLDYDNLQSLCHSCHSKKTKREGQDKKIREIEGYIDTLNSFN